jgi:hypothetical protein
MELLDEFAGPAFEVGQRVDVLADVEHELNTSKRRTKFDAELERSIQFLIRIKAARRQRRSVSGDASPRRSKDSKGLHILDGWIIHVET